MKATHMKRYGSVIGLRPGKTRRIQKTARRRLARRAEDDPSSATSGTTRFTCAQLDDGRHYLFSYFEYTGNDFAADMAKMAADPATQHWWAVCKPCQQPLADRAPDEWWANMEEVFTRIECLKNENHNESPRHEPWRSAPVPGRSNGMG